MSWKPIHRTADGAVTFMRPTAEGGWEFKTVTDVTETLDDVRRLATAGHDGYTQSRNMRHIASVPLALVEQWRREGLDVLTPRQQAAEVRKRLADIDFRNLRVGGGR